MLNPEGFVAECTADNVFVVKHGTLLHAVAAPTARSTASRAASSSSWRARRGIPARETRLARYDLYIADECFLTGTGAEIMPIAEVDGRRSARHAGAGDEAARRRVPRARAARGRSDLVVSARRPGRRGGSGGAWRSSSRSVVAGSHERDRHVDVAGRGGERRVVATATMVAAALGAHEPDAARGLPRSRASLADRRSGGRASPRGARCRNAGAPRRGVAAPELQHEVRRAGRGKSMPASEPLSIKRAAAVVRLDAELLEREQVPSVAQHAGVLEVDEPVAVVVAGSCRSPRAAASTTWSAVRSRSSSCWSSRRAPSWLCWSAASPPTGSSRRSRRRGRGCRRRTPRPARGCRCRTA